MTQSTIQGDRWDVLSRRIYGAEARAGLLMLANPAHIQTVIFPAGAEINAPAPPKPQPVRNANHAWRN